MPECELMKEKPHPHVCEAGPIIAPPAGCVPAYAEVCVTSNYTFLTGASHPEEMVAQAAALGYRAVAITDVHTLAGVVRAHVEAKNVGVRVIIGSRVRLRDLPGWSLCLYPTDVASYGRLCRLLTLGKRRAPKGECWLWLADVEDFHAGLLAVAVEEEEGPVASGAWRVGGEKNEEVKMGGRVLKEEAGGTPAPLTPAPHELGPIAVLRRLRAIFDDDRLSLAARVVYGGRDAEVLSEAAALSAGAGVPLVATNDAYAHRADRRMLQDVLTCIRHTCTLGQAGFRLHANAERHLKAPAEMHRVFAGFPRALSRTLEIAERTRGFSLDLLKYEYPDEVVPVGYSAQEYLCERVWAGAAKVYEGGVPEKVRGQIEHELRLIDELKYAPYFLTVYDLVRFARSGEEWEGQRPAPGWKGPILCQGRGAAANSAVCFCLGVTAVDPAKFSLLFERFISRERNEPPDIDIDFEHERREEVIQYIYRKYGRERAALTAEVISYRRRSAIRDVGKALGLSLDLVDRLAKSLEWFDRGILDPAEVRAMGLDPADETLGWLTRLVRELLGFPRHLSQHVGGFVITRRRLSELVPIENAAMPERTVIEWDKDDIDAMGMLKVDCLGLGMLTAVAKALVMVNRKLQRFMAGHKGTKAPRRQGAIGKECTRGPDTDASRPHRLAALQGARESSLPRYQEHAQRGAVGLNQPDAPSGGIRSVQHCRGVCEAIHGGLSALSANGAGLARRVLDPVRVVVGTEHDPSRAESGITPAGCGQDAASVDHESPELRAGSVRDVASCLRAFVPLCLRTIFQLHFEDPATYAMIQKADTVGVFQIESRAQMSMLPRLKPKEFYDLVIEVAIVRPGPIQGDMVHPYLRRRSGEEPVEYAHPAIEEVLGKTLGVPLFQEQCMALAIKAAGFTPGEADQLRRAMAAWKRKGDQIYRFGQRLIEGMVERGIPRDFAERCFEQIKGFSEYGFPESHAASFALIVYASAWLKRHHPAEFCAALINSQPMGFYAPAQLVRDAREHGVEVRAIDVNFSGWDCRMEEGAPASSHPAVRLGMRLVRGLSERDARKIEEAVEASERAGRGRFASMLALWRASGASAAGMRRLASADAFGSMGLSRQQALWQARLLRDGALPLFDRAEESDPEGATAPLEERGGLEQLPRVAPLRQVALDYGSTGLSLKAHPVSFVRPRLRDLRVVPCAHLRDPVLTPEGNVVRVAGLVLVRQRPGTAKDVTFMTIEDETAIANLVIWSRTYDTFRREARGRLLVAIGRVQRQGEVVHVVVSRLKNFDQALGEMPVASRDFH